MGGARGCWTRRWLLMIGTTAAFLMAAAIAADQPRLPNCLSSDPHPKRSGGDCVVEDPLGLASDSDVVRALASTGVARNRVTFYGCPNTDFKTQIATEGFPSTYTITYPVDSELTRAQLVAPVVHEIAHVFQLSESDKTINELLDDLGSRRVELGADFLAGWMFKRTQTLVSRSSFELNLELSGSYRHTEDDHGWPEERTFAFRSGFFNEKSSITSANAEFQRDVYGMIVGLKPQLIEVEAQPAPAVVPLDKLSACTDVRSLRDQLRTGRFACRAADGPLEVAVAARVGEAFRTDPCFIEPPVPRLRAFQCYVVETPRARELSCFRPSSPTLVTAYRGRFDTVYAGATARYLAAATACGLGWGEATHTAPSMMPTSLGMIGRHQLGFVLPLGGTRPNMGTTAIHGFAAQDPSIEGDGKGFEYFSLWIRR